jgi:hypothetical protein
MIKQNVFIINFNLLYEILDEIKENLTFKIIKYDHEKDFIRNLDLDLTNSLIIGETSQKLINIKNVTNNNFLSFVKYPLSLNKILEQINIQLIKLKFNHQSKINIRSYELNLNSKYLSKDRSSLKLTEKEVNIILYLNDMKIKHTVADLQKNIWGYSLGMETHTVETHIYRLRKKISNKFNDENFILSDPSGYFMI